MNTHCANTCPVVAEAVKAATPESKIAMAIAAIENDKISENAAAQRFGVPRQTLSRHRTKAATCSPGQVAVSKPEAAIGKDGKARKPPATPEDIARAWDMKDSGMSTAAIAHDMKRPKRTVREWFRKGRPTPLHATQPLTAETSVEAQPSSDPSQVRETQPPAPEPEVTTPSTPEPELALEPVIPKAKLKPISPENRKLQASQGKWITQRWLPAAQQLVEAVKILRAEGDRLGQAWRHKENGGQLFTIPYQRLAAEWQEKGYLAELAKALGCKEQSLDAVLLQLQHSAEVCVSMADGIRMYTGCRQDNNFHN